MSAEYTRSEKGKPDVKGKYKTVIPKQGQKIYAGGIHCIYNEPFVVTIDNGMKTLLRKEFDGTERFMLSIYAKRGNSTSSLKILGHYHPSSLHASAMNTNNSGNNNYLLVWHLGASCFSRFLVACNRPVSNVSLCATVLYLWVMEKAWSHLIHSF